MAQRRPSNGLSRDVPAADRPPAAIWLISGASGRPGERRHSPAARYQTQTERPPPPPCPRLMCRARAQTSRDLEGALVCLIMESLACMSCGF